MISLMNLIFSLEENIPYSMAKMELL